MTYTRKWTKSVAPIRDVDGYCQQLTGSGWTVSGILSLAEVRHEGIMQQGACIVAFKDEPDLTGGVPR